MRGNSGAAPLKVLDERGLATGGKRWRFVPLSKRLEHTSARPAALPSLDFDSNLTAVASNDTNFSHFKTTLSTESDTNITATYNAYCQNVSRISLSLPLLLRNRKKILDDTLQALEVSTRNGAEATTSISRCLAALARDLGPQMFYPCFRQVVKAISDVFATDRRNRHPSGDIVHSVNEQSIMWDPEMSIVPLFVSLADITKILLKQLAADPQKTCADLYPLLSNRSRRVREMTAEACVGYLIRKTRDFGSLRELTNALIEDAVLTPVSSVNEANLIDGLGASLFEAVRAPHGRMQSRASKMVKYAIRSFGARDWDDKDTAMKEVKLLSVVARCFRDVARYLKHGEDIRALCDLLVAEGKVALRSRNAWRTGGILFLLRNWIRSKGEPFNADVGRQGIETISCFLSTCFTAFIGDSRVVYEAFGAVLVLSWNDVSNYRQGAVQKVTSTIQMASKCFGRDGLLAVLYALLCTLKADLTVMPVPVLLKSLSSLYERLSDFCLPSNPDIPLLASVQLFRRIKKDAHNEVSFSAFRVPRLQDLIKRILSNLHGKDDDLNKEQKAFFNTTIGKYIMIEYLCNIRVPGIDDSFNYLLDSCESWTSSEFPAILTAFSRNFAEHTEDVGVTTHCISGLGKRILILVKDALFSGSLLSASLLNAILSYIRAFPLIVKERLLEDENNTERLFSMLSNGLSSCCTNVRQNSAFLLSSLYSILSHGSEHRLSHTTNMTVDDVVKQLRLSSTSLSAGNVQGMYDSFVLLLSVPNSLEAIAGNERVLRQLVRTSSSQSIQSNMVETLIKFSIGLLRTPLRVLWDGAKDLWCAMANIDGNSAMHLALAYMRDIETRLLKDDPFEEGDVDNLLTEREALLSEETIIDAKLSTSNSRHASSVRTSKIDNQSCSPEEQENLSALKNPHVYSNRTQGLEWVPREWQGYNIWESLRDDYDFEAKLQSESQEALDSSTSLIQLLKVLSVEPKHTVQHRPQLIRSFLNLNSSFCHARGLSQVLSTFTTLLERMGGLKCCETDADLERKVRDSLLLNLTKTHVPLQTATVRCLCLSRSPFLKPYRDSFVRLLSEKTFREELTVLTESLYKQEEGSVNVAGFSDKERQVCDVLTRISFSKIRGKQNKLESKRSAVLSFLVAKIPWTLAMPMITSLALSPIEREVSKVESTETWETQALNCRDNVFPNPSVQKGVLLSIAAIVKYCKRALPEDSWRRLALGTTILLRNSSQGSFGQAVRSRALVILADMVKVRPSDSEFLVGEVFQAVQYSEFDTIEYTGSTGVPALMYYVDAVMSSASKECCLHVMKEYAWALKYSVQAMKNIAAGLKAVTISISVGQGLAQALVEVSDRDVSVTSSEGMTCTTALLDFICIAIRKFFSWIIECLKDTKASQKKWSPVFVQALTLTMTLANLSSPHFKTLYPLADGLCAFLEKGVGFTESRAKALHALESITLNATSGDCVPGSAEMQNIEALIVRLLPLLNMRDIIDDPQSISSLCRIISKSPSSDMAAVGVVLESVTAFDPSRLNEPDYDRRIESLQVINRSLKKELSGLDQETAKGLDGDISFPDRKDNVCELAVGSLGPNAISALLYGCLSAVRTDDTAVRGSAGYSLSLMAKWAGNTKEENGKLSRTRMFTVLVSNVAACKTMSVRREYCRSLGELVRCGRHNSSKFFDPNREGRTQEWNAGKLFSVMTGLANTTDLDADFFENLVHLQPHRRGRALRQLAKHMKDLVSTLSEEDSGERNSVEWFAFKFAQPLGLNIALEKPINEEPRSAKLHRRRESREGAQKDVLNWAIELVGTSAAILPWTLYRSFLSVLLRRLKSEGDAENVNILLKLLVSTSKAYPRPDDVRSPGLEESATFLTSKIIPEMLSHVNSSAIEGEVLASNNQALYSSKTNRMAKDAASFRAPIAIAAGELMTCLPSHYLDSHVSLLIAPLSGALRSRISRPREEAKKALAALVLILGSKYMNYILSQVLDALKDGFRRDACVYVIYAVLTGIHDFCRGTSEQAVKRKLFLVDNACNLLVSFLIQELESGLGESRQDFADPNTSSERARQASLRALKVFECVELLAEHITFEVTATEIVGPFLYSYKRATSAKLLNKIRLALKHIVQGFSRNYSMKAEDALKTCYAYTNWNGMVLPQETPNEMLCDTLDMDVKDSHGIESVNFGLELLNVVISRNTESMNGTDKRGRVLQSMCEPFLPLVVSALTVGNDELAHIAFRTCQKLLKLPLSGRAHVADKLSETVVDVLAVRAGGVSSGRNLSSGDDLFNACLRAGAVLLHEVDLKGFTVVSKERVEALVNISCNCIEHGSVDSRSAALALLRAVVSQRVILPCVYDAMEKVNEMAIHSHSTSLRKSCISLSVGFLVCFPLGSKRVRQNLEFFVRNLNYSSGNGRIAALQALEVIITRFPCEALESESEYLFVALTAAGARDEDGECRSRAIECLKKLFQKWGFGRHTMELLRMGVTLAGVRCSMNESDDEVKYYGGTDPCVQRAGILGLTAAGWSGHLKKTQLRRIALVALLVLKEIGNECEWETRYGVLRCIEACIESQDDENNVIEVDEELFSLWEQIANLLIDKHEWVRIVACRLLGRHLSGTGGKHASISKSKPRKGWMWSRNDVVRNTMKALCLELEASHLSMELAEQALKNLVCMASVLREHPWAGEANEEKVEDKNEKQIGRTLRWLVTRMSGMASRGGTEEGDLVRRACGLRFLVVTGTWWGKWILEKVGGLYIRPVVKVLEGGELRRCMKKGMNETEVTTQNVIELGQKLQETVLTSMETEEYYEEYRRILVSREATKLKRKRRQIMEAAIDGETRAKKKRAQTEGKRKRKKKGGNIEDNHKSLKLTDEM